MEKKAIKNIFVSVMAGSLATGTLMISGCFYKSENTLKQAEAQRRLGEAYINQGEFTLAIQKLKDAEKISGDDHIINDDLGIAYMARKEYDKSAAHFKRAIEIKSDYAPAINNLGTLYMNMGKWDDAIACFEKLGDDSLVYSTPHYPLTNLGLVYYNKKMYEKSIFYFQKALTYSPNYTRALLGMAKTRLAMNRSDLAIESLQKALKVSPNSAEIHYEMGEAYYAAGQNEKAVMSFQKAVEIGKDKPVGILAKKRLDQI